MSGEPVAPSTAAADPQAAPVVESLDDLRQEIDRIDDAILDLIAARTALVERVGAAKRAAGESTNFLRPGRETAILRRLLARHRGPFPRPIVIRLWRELLAATVSLQKPLTLAVHMPERGAGYLDLARDQYGSYTAAQTYQSPGTVARTVATGEAMIGILPLPHSGEAQPWWPSLASLAQGTPRVIGRLPLCGPGPGRGDGVEALAIAQLAPEDTGNDRTLLVIETDSNFSRASARAAVESLDLTVCDSIDSHDMSDSAGHGRLHLLELAGFVTQDDPRLKRPGPDGQIMRLTIIGAYPQPFTAEDLGA